MSASAFDLSAPLRPSAAPVAVRKEALASSAVEKIVIGDPLPAAERRFVVQLLESYAAGRLMVAAAKAADRAAAALDDFVPMSAFAEVQGKTVATLRRWAREQRGPVVTYRSPREPGYLVSDIEEWKAREADKRRAARARRVEDARGGPRPRGGRRAEA